MKWPPPIALRRALMGGGLFLGALAAPATASGEMTVAEFLAKAESLRTGGAAALDSPDIKQLRTDMAAVTRDYRATIARQRASGEPPHSCPPSPDEARLGSNDLLREFRSIPVAERGVSIHDAFYAMMARRYPCGELPPD